MKEFEQKNQLSPNTLALIQALLEDEDVQAYQKEKGFSQEDVKKNFINFLDWKKHHEVCKNCFGYQQCQGDVKGYRYQLDESCALTLTPCEYYRKRIVDFAHKKNYAICDISESNLKTSLDTFDLSNETDYYKSVVELLQQWAVEDSSKGFYIYGGIGAGKTYLACALCNDLTRKGKRVAFVNFPRLVSDIRNNVAEKNYVDERLRKMRQAQLLVLDDIGAENMTAYIRDDILFTVLDYRMEQGYPTIFTSNCTLEKLAQRYLLVKGDEDQVKVARLMERISASISCQLPITGKSRRGK